MNSALEMQNWIERLKIAQIIVDMANAFDQKNWQALRTYLADEIEVDYSEFRGDLPQIISADVYIQQRIAGLQNLKTLHVSTNHQVTIQADRAECRSAYLIYRVDSTREPGRDRLDTAGNYDHRLVRVAEAWRVCGIRQTVAVLAGDRLVHGAFSEA